jgi:catechol 2,3-dioxygenase-like lactoylglutathione lyase family enzyme
MNMEQNYNPEGEKSSVYRTEDPELESLPWHHVHITLPDREAAAIWLTEHSSVERRAPTKRSENLYLGPNLLQIQTEAMEKQSGNARIDSIGMGVTDLDSALVDWQAGGGIVLSKKANIARVEDPWGTPYELIKADRPGFTHINIETPTPEALRSWYEKNLGGKPVVCMWDIKRLALLYDTIQIVFAEISFDDLTTGERIIDHLGWFTDDLDTSCARLSENGVSFPVPPKEFGPVRLAFAEDPGGIWFELLEPPDGINLKPIS